MDKKKTDEQETWLWKFMVSFQMAFLEPLFLPFASLLFFAQLQTTIESKPTAVGLWEALDMNLRADMIPLILFIIAWYIWVIIRAKLANQEKKDRKETLVIVNQMKEANNKTLEILEKLQSQVKRN